MAIETRLSKTWRNRQLLIAAMAVAVGAWFLWDGLVAWPESDRLYKIFEEMQEKHGGETVPAREEWASISQDKGWPKEPPEKFHGESGIMQQYVCAGLAFAGAAFALYLFWSAGRRSIRSENGIIHGERGETVPIESIQSLDKKKWDSKGIALAYYEKNGSTRKLVIDDYKYEGAEEILRQVEEHLGIPPEEPPEPAMPEPSGQAAPVQEGNDSVSGKDR